jgi:hypothetical protein
MPNVVVAALIHDAVEDQGISGQTIAAMGENVAGLVLEATDKKSLPQDVRKRLQVDQAPKKSQRAKILKLADKISKRYGDRARPAAGLADRASTWLRAMGPRRGCRPPGRLARTGANVRRGRRRSYAPVCGASALKDPAWSETLPSGVDLSQVMLGAGIEAGTGASAVRSHA